MRITLLFFCFLNVLVSHSQTSFPSYKTIVNQFFSQYSSPSSEYEQLKFLKKPTGWHVATESYNEGYFQEIKQELFWDKESASFRKLLFDPATASSASEATQFLQSSSAWLLDTSPYFNYDGWEIDVINDFGKNEHELSDSTLYGLGRAYSSYATQLVGNQYGESKAIEKFDLGRYDRLNEEQLAKYRLYQHRAIEIFQQLEKRNPDFQTIVGSIGVKAANQHLTSFFDLMLYGDEKEAAKELKDDLYADFYVATAKNYLNSCAPNAILFTGGDTDTYALWYVQAKYGFRRDVSVMVVSFLNDNRAIDLITRSNTMFPHIKLSIDVSKYDAQGPNAYLPVTDQIESAIDLENYLALLNQENKSLRYPLGDTYYNVMPSSRISLKTERFFEIKELPSSLISDASDPSMEIAIEARGLEMKDLLLLDLIATNNWNRPIYFNSSSLYALNFSLQGHVVNEGLCQQLLPLNNGPSTDFQTMYENIMNRFEWDLIPSGRTSSPTQRNFVLNYRSAINGLVEALILNNETQKAKEVLTANFKWMPETVFPWDYFSASQISFLLQLSETEQALTMAEDIFNQSKTALDDLLKRGVPGDSFEVIKNLRMLQILSSTFNQHQIQDLSEKYENTYSEYRSQF